MPVIVKLDTGDNIRVDRRLSTVEVAARVNKARPGGHIIQFQNDATPSRTIYIDPNHVVSIEDDGYSY